MATKILQWNCRGLRCNLTGLQVQAQDLNPVAFSLQETFVKDTNYQCRGYVSHHAIATPRNDKASGVSFLLIRHGVVQCHLVVY